MLKPDQTLLTDDQRDTIINLLVDDWISTLCCDATSMQFYVREWLMDGRVGYYDHSDDELVTLADDAGLFDEQGE